MIRATKSKKGRRPISTILWGVGVAILLLTMARYVISLLSFETTNHILDSSGLITMTSDGLDFWWVASLKDTPLSLSSSHRKLVFPETTKRVWVDVGVNKESDFLPELQVHKDLFLIGFEPSEVYKPCSHERCVCLWAACTPDYEIVHLNVQSGADLCDSLLKPKTETTTRLWKGCVTQMADSKGQPKQVQVPGIPLHELVSRIPQHVIVEYIKIDAQGYDLEVMKGALPATDRIQVVSLEAMNVTDRSKLLYHGQPTLEEIIDTLAGQWHHIISVSNHGVDGEVNAFFVSNMQYAHKVDELSKVLMSNKEGKGKRNNI